MIANMSVSMELAYCRARVRICLHDMAEEMTALGRCTVYVLRGAWSLSRACAVAVAMVVECGLLSELI